MSLSDKMECDQNYKCQRAARKQTSRMSVLPSDFRIKIDEERELRLISVFDAAAMAALIDQDRPYLREWMGWVDSSQTVEDSREYLRYELGRYHNRESLQMSILYRGSVVGQIGFNTIYWRSRRTEIGYWLGARFQGLGLMTSAVKAMTTYGFRHLGLHRIEIHCAVENRKSRAIPERLGFQQEGILRDNEWLYDHFVGHVVYSMLEQEWKVS